MIDSDLPHVVIVGRPNVGKSTLFNRLAGRRRALVHEMPGMTRDRLTDVIEIDEVRRYRLTDTGGLEYGENVLSAFATEIRDQANRAIREADLVLFVVDGAAGLVPEDEEIAASLRMQQKDPVLVVNKIDTRAAEANQHEFHGLGFDRVIVVSAEHGTNVDEVRELIEQVVPETTESVELEDGAVRLAIIGRPNVGKSSILNRLTNDERAVVSDIAGTTRDAIDSMIERNGKSYLIIDTAGIRRKGKTTEQVEKLAIMSARRAIERCEVALVILDATEGPTAQDATVAGYAEEAGKAALLVVNKWDLVETTPTLAREFELDVRRRLKFLSYAPIEFISAKSGRRIEKLFPVIDRIAESYRARFRTSELNQILERAVVAHHPASVRGKARRFYYATQVKAQPPTIALFSNVDEPLHFSYKRYLENAFRDALGLVGTPVHLLIRGRKGMKRER